MRMSGPGRHTFLVHLCGYLFLAGVCSAVGYFGLPGRLPEVFPSAGERQVWLQLIGPAALAGAALWSVIWWVFLRRSFGAAAPAPAPAPKAAGEQDESDLQREAAARRRYREQRLYLHLVASLQRDGRLLDFLNEDLDGFEDEQIGAAVRNIHGSCRKSIRQSLAPVSILEDVREGDTTVVEADFDAAAVKLVGNVTGEPPFTGVVRHSGWRVKAVDLPEFTGSQSAGILAPAEVEIN